jgi:hypothetical protein
LARPAHLYIFTEADRLERFSHRDWASGAEFWEAYADPLFREKRVHDPAADPEKEKSWG